MKNSTPAQALIASQLLQNYTQATIPIGGVYQFRLGLDAKDTRSAPFGAQHIFTTDKDGKVKDWSPDQGSLTGWRCQNWTWKDHATKALDVCLDQAANLFLFALSDNTIGWRNVSAKDDAWKTFTANKANTMAALSGASSPRVYFDRDGAKIQYWENGVVTDFSSQFTKIQKISIGSTVAPNKTYYPQVLFVVYRDANKETMTAVLDPQNAQLLCQYEDDAQQFWNPPRKIFLSRNGTGNMLALSAQSQNDLGTPIDPAAVFIQGVTDFTVFQNSDCFDAFALRNGETLHFPLQGDHFPQAGAAIARNIRALQTGGNPEAAELYLVDANRNVLVMTRAEDGVWRKNPLFAEDPTQVKSVPFTSYVTEVTIGDENGIPLADETVYFKPNEADLEVDISGKVYFLDAEDQPLTLKTNGAGKITLTVHTTNLSTPQLLLWGDFSRGKKILVEPNGKEQATLGSIDLNGLKGAQKQTSTGAPGGKLFPDPSQVNDDFVQALHSGMALTENQADPPTEADDFLDFSRGSPGLYVVEAETAAPHARIHKKSGQGRHFAVHFADRGLVYQALDRASAATRISRALESDVDATFEGSLQDVFRGALEGAITLTDLVVSDENETGERDFWDGLRTVVNFVMDGIAYVIDATIRFIHEAFAMVESFFAKLGVLFDDLFDWLGSFFCWQDILNTKEVIKHFINDALSQFPGQMDTVKRQFPGWIDEIFSDKSTALSAAVPVQANSLNQGISQTDASRRPLTPQDNWVTSKSTDHADKVTLGSTAVLTSLVSGASAFSQSLVKDSAVAAALDGFSQTLSQQLDQQQGDISFKTILDLVTGIFTDVLKATAKTSGASGFDFAKTCLSVLNTVLNFRISIPVVTPLYEKVISPGSTLTLIDFLALAAAVPATLTYKLLSGGLAPIVKKGAVTDPARQLEINDMLGQSYKNTTLFSSLSSTTVTRDAAPSSSQLSRSVILSTLLGGTYSVFLGMAGVFDFLSRITPKADTVLPGGQDTIRSPARGFAGVSLVFSWMAQLVSVPSYPWEPNTQAGTAPRTEFIVWCLQFLLNIHFTARFFSENYWKSYGGPSAQMALGLCHLMAFMVIYNQERDGNGSHSTDSTLKFVQNVLTAVGEFAEPGVGYFFMDKDPPTPLSIAASAVFNLLFVGAPSMINLVRACMTFPENVKHYSL